MITVELYAEPRALIMIAKDGLGRETNSSNPIREKYLEFVRTDANALVGTHIERIRVVECAA